MAERMKVLPSNRFQLILGSYILGFARASGLDDSVDYDSYSEGGANDYPWVSVKPSQQPHILTLEKGAQLRPLLGKSIKLLPGTEIVGGVGLMVFGETDLPCRYFFSDWAMVVKWELSSLDASANEVLIERIEIAHSGLREME